MNETKLRVYYVEDSAEVWRRIGEEIAKVPGVVVVGGADRVGDAIRGIRELIPDCVILDLNLAEGSGIEVMRVVRADPNPPFFVVLTNHSDPAFRELSMRAGASYFFDKASGIGELLSLLERPKPD